MENEVDGVEMPAESFRSGWFALHVKPRTEKKSVEYLRLLRCIHYLPTYVKVTRVQRRKVRRVLPLFPGYVFARLPAGKRQEMFRTQVVVRTIPVPNARATVHELRQVARAVKGAPDLVPSRSVFKEGDYVRVEYGPLRGTKGYVKRNGSRATLCINVDILGSSVEMSISPSDIVKIDADAR